jgi:23S rRNA pseudouridine1911/1915/1917 synthase
MPELPPLEILFEDNHVIAVVKPAGISSTHYDGTDETLDRHVKAYLKVKYEKPGEVFLGIVHRLDKPTSGVHLFARTSKAAARISEQFREGGVDKVYWALVEGKMTSEDGTLEDWLWKDDMVGHVSVVQPGAAGAKHSLVHFHVRGEQDGLSWLELRPQTGRTHQLRVQLSSRRHPILGDFKYGSEVSFRAGIALHARSLAFLHPIRHETITLTAELPASWRRYPWIGRS